jgi:hypothetical protein
MLTRRPFSLPLGCALLMTTGHRTLSQTASLKASPFAAFLQRSYADPEMRNRLKLHPVPMRGQLLAKMFRDLPDYKKAELVEAGKRMKLPPRKKAVEKAKSRKPRSPTKYNAFFKDKASDLSIRALPVSKRMKAIAKLWKESQGTTL